MFTMYDTVTLSEIPKQPHAVATYINGRFANYDQAKRDFPGARILGISVNGIVPADCYDVEQGDYEPSQVPELYRTAIQHGIWRPCFYAQLSGVMPAVIAELNRVIQARKDVRLWVAYYNDQPDLPEKYDAHQFTDHALGRNLDESICASDFFRPAFVAPPAPKIEHTMRAMVTFDPDEKGWSIAPAPAGTEVEKPGA